MSKALEAARDAIVALRFSDTPHGPDEYARAAITAYHRAIAEDEGDAFALGEAADCEMASQTSLGVHVNLSEVGRAILRELEPKND